MSQSNDTRAWACTALLGLASALGGCALQGGAVPLSTADDEAPAASSGEGLSSYTTEYTWERKRPSTRMLASAGSVCLLTGIHGKFRGTSEMVKISNVHGYWYLTGISHQAGVGASARCFPYDSSKVVATRISESSSAGDLDLGAHRLCGLSRVSGDFEGNDVVRVYQADNGHWFLQTLAVATSVNGGALCLDDDPAASNLRVSREFSVNQGEPTIIVENLSLEPTQPTEPLKGPACFVTRMTGDFSSPSEGVETYPAAAAGAWNFYLRAKGVVPNVATSGVCLH